MSLSVYPPDLQKEKEKKKAEAHEACIQCPRRVLCEEKVRSCGGASGNRYRQKPPRESPFHRSALVHVKCGDDLGESWKLALGRVIGDEATH